MGRMLSAQNVAVRLLMLGLRMRSRCTIMSAIMSIIMNAMDLQALGVIDRSDRLID